MSTRCACARTRRPTSLAPSCSTHSTRWRRDGRRRSPEPSRRSIRRGRRGTRRCTWATRGARATGCSSPTAPASRRRSSAVRQPTTAPSIRCSASTPIASRVSGTFRRESATPGRTPPHPAETGGPWRGASCAAAWAVSAACRPPRCTRPLCALPAEAAPRFAVPADSIVPTTGALTSLASRVHPQFGHVIAIGSDLQSDTRQLTVGVSRLPPRGATLQLSYTFTRARDQSSFSCCAASQGFAAPTTAGDPNEREWATSAFERRHSLLAIVTYPVNAALAVTALGRLTSGAPFTPLVGADINGDGARNDRAFVFDPATASDPAVATAMRALLATAPPAVRDCLRRQLGHVAGRNSCAGPWQPALDFQINWRPAYFGPARRLTVSLLTVNLLGGVDLWLHGAANLHGWGFAAAPDPVLLSVRGFDPVAQRFGYGVNGRFGATVAANGGVTVPFQIAIQAHLIVGPIAPSRRVRALLGEPGAPGARGGGGGGGGGPRDFAARLAQILAQPQPAILSYRDPLP